jgi:death-on-curing protein
MEIYWIDKKEVAAIHDKQLSLHGGSGGTRDEGLLESALARPLNLAAYASEPPSLPRLAASYAFGLAKNHPFVDGNKRTALVVSFTFLEMNGLEMTASQEDSFYIIYGLAAGKVTEDQLAAWFEKNSAPLTA